MLNSWMDEKEKNIILKYLNSEVVMMEWGSGGSTLEFSKLVNQYYSVEHNLDWFNQINPQSPPNTKVYYRPSTKLPTTYHQSEYVHYKSYIDIVDMINKKFDVVLIDGRARRLCAYKIMSYLKENSIVIIHDWCTRPPYKCVLDYYDLIEKVDDTPQTIAVFKLKNNWNNIKGYDLSLGSFDRLNE